MRVSSPNPPAKIGPYEVLAKLGEGGMGVVYKARDSRLGRLVALKVLPLDALGNAELRSRFIREARAASALNHPSIVTIHDIGQDGEALFIVMECVSGRTLSQAIPRGGMKLADLLTIGVQIADGLARAHKAGVVHRDLKPANVMLTEEGSVKLLDFGLAKMNEAESGRTGGEFDAEAETMTRSDTQEGIILGTVGYMSPEQVEGKPVDGRSDIFSLGAILYQMATGQRAFHGDSNASTLAAILREEPRPIRTLASDVPPELDRLIFRCLRKDPNRRFQHAEDLKIALEELKEESESGRLDMTKPAPRRFGWLLWIALGLIGVAGIVTVAIWLGYPGSNSSRLPTTLVPLTSFPGNEREPSFSPDGNQIAFAWEGERQDNRDIYVKMIGSPALLRLTTYPGPEASPAWSPDGRFIAFCRFSPPPDSDYMWLVVIPAIGGPERVLWEGPVYRKEKSGANVWRFICWSPDGKWIVGPFFPKPEQQDCAVAFYSVETDEVRRIPLSVFSPGVAVAPSLSPDSQSLLFERNVGIGSQVCTLPLSSDFRPAGVVRSLGPIGSSPIFTPDGREILFGLPGGQGGLWRMPAHGGAVTRVEAAGDADVFDLCISSNGKRVALAKWIGDTNLYRLDLDSSPSQSTRVFLSSTREDFGASFSPDGGRIVFVSNRSGPISLWLAAADGSGAHELFLRPGCSAFQPDWSPDGRQIVFVLNSQGRSEIYKISAQGGQPVKLTDDPIDEFTPYWSRDGGWIYFSSAKTGRWEVWKVPSEGGQAVQVTHRGGFAARQSPSGEWLYYIGDDTEHETLWRVKTAGGKEEKILTDIFRRGFFPFEDGLYFVTKRADGQWEMKYKDFRSGVATTLDRTAAGCTGLTISPDRSALVQTRTERDNVDLMMLENYH